MQVVDLLKAPHLNGELVSGDRVWAADLAEEFGTSVIPVKEALLILQGENFIVSVPRRGSIVRRFTRTEMEELYDLREMIEIEALKRARTADAVDRALIAELTECNEAIGALRKNGGSRTNRQPSSYDRQFHDILVGASGHQALSKWYTRLNQQVQIIRYASWNIGPRGDKTYNEHAHIIRALAGRDLREGKRAIREHLASIRSDFRKAMDTGTDGAVDRSIADYRGRRKRGSPPRPESSGGPPEMQKAPPRQSAWKLLAAVTPRRYKPAITLPRNVSSASLSLATGRTRTQHGHVTRDETMKKGDLHPRLPPHHGCDD